MDILCIQIELLINGRFSVRIRRGNGNILTILDFPIHNGHEPFGLGHRFKAVRSITVIVHDPLPICIIGQGAELMHIVAARILVEKTLGFDIHQGNNGSCFIESETRHDILIGNTAQMEQLRIGFAVRVKLQIRSVSHTAAKNIQRIVGVGRRCDPVDTVRLFGTVVILGKIPVLIAVGRLRGRNIYGYRTTNLFITYTFDNGIHINFLVTIFFGIEGTLKAVFTG